MMLCLFLLLELSHISKGRQSMGERQQAGIGEGGGPGRERQEEARRILERLEREHVGAEGIVRRGFFRTAQHLSAAGAPENDAIELWATRVGRGLGLLITLAIIVWLISYLMQSQV
ncbi:hypothetical protein BMEI0220 [Brucella melitensis bv. 1 str. 16M]|uniref:Uncharacterized protein n=1 Tax=Brucella melitensis biotype 1 (strain ATCC 23456 / CCUG 17765 / NCTC 10094 / 16M) TaxID=224914 RepID=Q8YJ66_BRUME|nr:hypothetical protein BMEI0220 [Brucella melitensis bv. 1 str. 16M]